MRRVGCECWSECSRQAVPLPLPRSPPAAARGTALHRAPRSGRSAPTRPRTRPACTCSNSGRQHGGGGQWSNACFAHAMGSTHIIPHAAHRVTKGMLVSHTERRVCSDACKQAGGIGERHCRWAAPSLGCGGIAAAAAAAAAALASAGCRPSSRSAHSSRDRSSLRLRAADWPSANRLSARLSVDVVLHADGDRGLKMCPVVRGRRRIRHLISGDAAASHLHSQHRHSATVDARCSPRVTAACCN